MTALAFVQEPMFRAAFAKNRPPTVSGEVMQAANATQWGLRRRAEVVASLERLPSGTRCWMPGRYLARGWAFS